MTILSPELPSDELGTAAAAKPHDVLDAHLISGLHPPVIIVPSAWRQRTATVGWGVVGLLGLAAVWQLAHVQSEGLPGPGSAIDTLGSLLADAFAKDGPAGKGIGLQLWDSLQRVLRGFALAAVIGVPLGFLLGTSRRAHRIANPLIQLLKPVSPMAWFPVWLTVMVRSEPAAIGVIFITAVWPILINTAAGASSVPSYQRDVARVFRFSRWTELREIVIPHALPQTITGLRLSMGIAWMVIVAAEMLSASSGIGFYIWQSYNGVGLSHVLACIVIIGVVGLVLDLAFQWLGHKVAHEEGLR